MSYNTVDSITSHTFYINNEMYAAFVPIDKTTGSLIRCSLQFQGLWHDLRHLVRYLVVIHMATMIEMYEWFKQSNKNISISKLDYH